MENQISTDTDAIKKILRIPWTTLPCAFHGSARRAGSEPSPSVEELAQRLRSHGNNLCVSIDGQTGTGKSTISRSITGRAWSKINGQVPHMSRNGAYNVCPLLAVDYLFGQLSADFKGFTSLDRGPFSNLVFSIVHYLMITRQSTPILPDDPTVWDDMVAYATNTHLDAILTTALFLTPNGKNITSVYIVCSCPDVTARAMLERGLATNNRSDISNAGNYNYHMAQYHAFKFVAYMLKERVIVIDLVDWIKEGYSYGDLQSIITTNLAPSLDLVEFQQENDGMIIGNRDAEAYVHDILNRISLESCMIHSKK